MANQPAASGSEEINLLQCGRSCTARYLDPECRTCYMQRSRSFILKIERIPRFDSDERIYWVLECPARATFSDFHLALQVTFGWTNSYHYNFAVFEHDNPKAREEGLLATELGFKITTVPVATTVDTSTLNPRIRDSSKVKLYHVFNDPMPDGWSVEYVNENSRGKKHAISCIERRDPALDFLCLSGKCQGWNKVRVNEVFGELSTAQDRGRPKMKASVLLISLNKQKTFDHIYADTIAKLRAKAVVTEVTHLFSAIYHLSDFRGPYNVVVVADPTIIKTNFRQLRRYLVNYIKAGGTTILGLDFYTAERADLMGFFESEFGFSWESDLVKSSVCLNPSSMFFSCRTLQPEVPHTYEVLARVLINVPAKYKVFTTTREGCPNDGNATAVFAKFREGFLGYIGDEEPTVASMELLVSMCGV